MAADGFTSKIVGVVIAVIVVAAVAIPVLTSITADLDAGTTKTILEILPVFLVLAVLMIVVKMFMNNRD